MLTTLAGIPARARWRTRLQHEVGAVVPHNSFPQWRMRDGVRRCLRPARQVMGATVWNVSMRGKHG